MAEQPSPIRRYIRATVLTLALTAAAASQAAVSVNLKYILYGATANGNLPMFTDLNTNAVLPLTDPYGGTVTLASLPANMVDWVNVELMSGASPASCNAVQSRPALLLSDGSVVDPVSGAAVNFASATPGSYNIRVRHRNHAALISTAQSLTAAAGPVVDFTVPATVVNSGNGIQVAGGLLAARAGDVDQNGVIDGTDAQAVNTDFNNGVFGVYVATDLYMDSVVDGSDIFVINNAVLGGNVAVPFTFPTAGAVCGVGAPPAPGNAAAIPALSPGLLAALSTLVGLAGVGLCGRKRRPR